ncbi:hypothetical protein XENOCAPTIV_025026 [Xenoophorus captivus]|uniref:Uncharacterized protein n=1 Tax=Xenoophorus captivus TaxID=1517983 RepID=A0ABV0S9N0_9TELE
MISILVHPLEEIGQRQHSEQRKRIASSHMCSVERRSHSHNREPRTTPSPQSVHYCIQKKKKRNRSFNSPQRIATTVSSMWHTHGPKVCLRGTDFVNYKANM